MILNTDIRNKLIKFIKKLVILLNLFELLHSIS